ncbi:MAG: class I SAM-dependent methyltransferase [Candidatus Staskawiczbacteria bacterium]|nr:class I SAM-dependent methyltransferase [Candidatus Staskawiczbacteria bacterium]
MIKDKNKKEKKIPSSFRDPSGFVFCNGDELYRQINFSYKKHYDYLTNSGFLKYLWQKDFLISHKEISLNQKFSELAYKVIQPEIVPFISYPYEWCFSELKDAALTMLQIQKSALNFGMCLKDASAYNIQFFRGKPILIDTLSFEVYEDGAPWIAYKQFCQHFLAPLALMSRNAHLGRLLRVFIDGIPLNLTSSLLTYSSFLNPFLCAHIHFHAKVEKRLEKETSISSKKYFLSKKRLIALVDNLESAVLSLRWTPKGTEWADYYKETNYSLEAFNNKKEIIGMFLDKIKPSKLWDIGSNTGAFSRIAAAKNIETVSFDVDSAAVEKNYLELKANHETNIIPLVFDIVNPSPPIGWANKERNSLQERGTADAILALALVHHLVISENIPFLNIAEFFSKIGNSLIIEFVPKEDSQLKRMLSSSIKNFPVYTQEEFEGAFQNYFSIDSIKPIKNSKRILYLMKKI